MSDVIEKVFEKKERNSDVMRSFGYRLRNQFSINESYRRAKELEWLESLRQMKGLYDPDVMIDPANSKVYPKITRSKVNIVLSRLHEMLFPDTDKNWEIEPTAEPKIAKEIVKMIAMALVKKDPQTGAVVLPTADELLMAIKAFAKACCEKMTLVIDDQLTEMDYPEETKRVLRSGLMYGTGVLKGPMINKRTKRRWQPLPSGDYEETVKEEELPFFDFVRIWDWYPDMSVTDLDKSEGSFERNLMTKHDLRNLMKRSDFYADIIQEYLRDHPNGDYVPKNWEVDLQVIEIESGQGGRRTTSMSASTSDDINRTSNRQMGKKYELLEFWGYVDGQDLSACGIEITDVELEYQANCWLLGNKIISAKLYDGALDKYKTFYYEKDETSLFGEGLPRIMRHSQIAIAAGARMVLDNAACVAGPQVEVNWDLVTPNTDINSFYPRKIWYRTGRGIDAQYPAIRSVEFTSHVEELLKIVDAFKQFGDEETTLPTWMIGQMVNNETAQATSGRMATITISIKDVVKNFDSFTERIIQDLYAWNMEFNPRPDIKGDYKVKARGVSSLVMKEIRMQALNQLATTMTPEDWVYVDRRDFLKARFDAHDINIKLKTEEEADKVRQQIAEGTMQKLTEALTKAEIDYKKAQTMGQLAKAKDHNVEAETKAAAPPAGGEHPAIVDANVAKTQAETDAIKQKAALEGQTHAAELAKTGQEMHHEAVRTGVDILHQHEQHQADLAAKGEAVAMKKAESSHGMQVKEKTAMIKAKMKPPKVKK